MNEIFSLRSSDLLYSFNPNSYKGSSSKSGRSKKQIKKDRKRNKMRPKRFKRT